MQNEGFRAEIIDEQHRRMRWPGLCADGVQRVADSGSVAFVRFF